ncbi:MAG: hypothetical protein A3I63_00955 [Betaproteobacteria bacterium RIFCSPLOWO2_02_FULL_66_14]|nr:MAG: hypothetical protein A3I63_00955 [Betaproteobacteria bacterium RIFCSPLOWO2_02_FULL_66_14]
MLATLNLPSAATLPAIPLIARVRVHSAEELRRALREARDRPLALDGSSLNCVLRSDEGQRLMEVQGAMSWSALAAWLGRSGEPLARWVAQAHPPESIGRSVSLDSPAPDGLPLARYVESIALVTLDGELRRVDRAREAPLFRLAVGGHGVFGLLYSVTLRSAELLRAAAAATRPAESGATTPEARRRCEVDALLPPEQAGDFLAATNALLAQRRLERIRISTRKLCRGAETALSWARRDWTNVLVQFGRRETLGASVHAAEVRRLLYAEALARSGSFPAWSAPGVSRAQLATCYPQLGEFIAEKRRYDPMERLQNDWYRAVSGLMNRTPCL